MLNDDSIMVEIRKEQNSVVDTSSLTSAQVLAGARRVKPHRIQNAILDSFKETKHFVVMKSQKRSQIKEKYTKKSKYTPQPQ